MSIHIPAQHSLSFNIRVARAKDAKGLAQLLAMLLKQPSLSQELEVALNSNLLRMLSTPGSALLVAESLPQTPKESPELLAFVSFWSHWGLFDDAPHASIDRIVFKEAQPMLAYALIEQALGAAQAMGCGSISYLAQEGNSDISEVLEHFAFAALEQRFSLEIK